MSSFVFDRCPVELICLIFKYLSGNDIFYSFLHTSSYMDSVLEYYNKYSFNFISITRKQFDILLSKIDVNKIVSITLSDGKLTGGQISLFLSRYSSSFHLFTHLKSLTLHSAVIHRDQYDLLIEALKQFKNLRFLNLDQIQLMNIDDGFGEAFRQLDNRCLIKCIDCKGVNINLISNCLQYLDIKVHLNPGFYSQQWPCLHTLKLYTRLPTSINRLLCLLPQLISLNITDFPIDEHDLPNFRPVSNLKYLSISLRKMSFNYLTTQSGLHTLTNLQQLELLIKNRNIDKSYLDGYQWEIFLSKSLPNLSKFDFHYSFSQSIDRSLNTFRSQFWLENKKWFVALQEDLQIYEKSLSLYTVPKYHTIANNQCQIITTTSPSFEHLNSNIDYFFFNTNNLTSLGYTSQRDNHCYEHVERFDIKIQETFDNSLYLINKVKCLINLNPIKTVRIIVEHSWKVHYQQIFDLIDHMPNLSKVIFDKWPMKESWSQVKRGNFRVTSIELPDITDSQNDVILNSMKQMFLYLFPSIEHIIVRIDEPDFCGQFNKYLFPWKNLSSLEINFVFQRGYRENQEQRINQWKEKYLKEILPQLSRRNFTFTDGNKRLNIWFGETVTN